MAQLYLHIGTKHTADIDTVTSLPPLLLHPRLYNVESTAHIFTLPAGH